MGCLNYILMTYVRGYIIIMYLAVYCRYDVTCGTSTVQVLVPATHLSNYNHHRPFTTRGHSPPHAIHHHIPLIITTTTCHSPLQPSQTFHHYNHHKPSTTRGYSSLQPSQTFHHYNHHRPFTTTTTTGHSPLQSSQTFHHYNHHRPYTT